ncbi:flagellar motor stator protein MotA [Azospirillum sp. SYSU D00513]|uniref:flagellar motor stator protein MotA n=1 Tax=Azospirillum sp. SYSU D00513 TaxID=2812561 RepID=UPI001A971029|nr:flagellar motor stator protein MotA [Azospirillum sp. SYSU D00513]
MQVLLGFVIVLGCVFGGYAIAGGHYAIILKALPLEFLIIGGAAVGAFVVSNTGHTVKLSLRKLKRAFGKPRYKKDDYVELLSMLYVVFSKAPRANVAPIERDIEDPENSALFKQFPRFHANHHAREFVCDYLRLFAMRMRNPHELDALMEQEIDGIAIDASHGSHALQKVADGLPALGIVAAVLGVIKTMASIDQPPPVLGKMIGSALVGTFLGVLLAYGIVGPLADKIKSLDEKDNVYYMVVRAAMVAFLGGSDAAVCVEFGRKMIPHDVRPAFKEVEEACEKVGAMIRGNMAAAA